VAKSEVTFNIKAAENNLRSVRKTLQESVDHLNPTFQAVAVEIVQNAVYGGPGSLAGMASDLAPVDTGALRAGLASPNSNEEFDKGRQSQSVFSVSPVGKGGVQYVGVTYGTDPTRDDGEGYAQYVQTDYLSAPAAKFRSTMGAIGTEISRAIASVIAANIRVAASTSGAYVTAKTRLSPTSVLRLIRKFGSAPIETTSGRGYGYRKLAAMPRSQYLKIMRQRRYLARKRSS
jgi:hypothetical protein